MCCKAQENKGPQVTKDPAVYKGVTDNACAIEMAFGSPGSGIDISAFNATMDLIGKHELAHTSKNIGREGETRICLPLGEVKGKKKSDLIAEFKKIAKEGQLVSISIR
jgi:hypothetical protein